MRRSSNRGVRPGERAQAAVVGLRRARARGAARFRCRRPATRRARRSARCASGAMPGPASVTVTVAARPSTRHATVTAPAPWRSALSSRTSRTWPTVPRDARTSAFLSPVTSNARRARANSGRQRAACSWTTDAEVDRLGLVRARAGGRGRAGRRSSPRGGRPRPARRRARSSRSAPSSAASASSIRRRSAVSGVRSWWETLAENSRSRATSSAMRSALLSSPWPIASISGMPKRPARTEKSPSPELRPSAARSPRAAARAGGPEAAPGRPRSGRRRCRARRSAATRGRRDG